ncbi:hypothetical protein BC829DRAFT_415811 [Chytridium lagenaria]|nr:hypothetical protein BC829DRAFT_415811 [Chytridium lagenaria]
MTVSLELSCCREICKLLLVLDGTEGVGDCGDVEVAVGCGLVGGAGGFGVICGHVVGLAGFEFTREQVWRVLSRGGGERQFLTGGGVLLHKGSFLVGGAGDPNVGHRYRRVGPGDGWGELLGQCIQWHTDNANNVAVFEKGYGSTPSLPRECGWVRPVVAGGCRGFPGAVPGQAQWEVVLPGALVAVDGGCVAWPNFMRARPLCPPVAMTTSFSYGSEEIVSFATVLPRNQSNAAVVRRIGVLGVELGLAGTAAEVFPLSLPGLVRVVDHFGHRVVRDLQYGTLLQYLSALGSHHRASGWD